MDNTFSEEVKQTIYDAQNGYCAMIECHNSIHSIHHKLSNNKANRNRFPLFIHSPFNAVGLCMKCHRDYSHLFKISEELAEVYENFLRTLQNG